jgi:hypothetical protein
MDMKWNFLKREQQELSRSWEKSHVSSWELVEGIGLGGPDNLLVWVRGGLCPVGTPESSPAIYRRVIRGLELPVP